MSEGQQSEVGLQEAVRIAVSSVKNLYKGQGLELRDKL